MFHRKLLGTTKAKKLDRGIGEKGKGERAKGKERKLFP